MGNKHSSAPVTAAQHDVPSMPYSSFVISSTSALPRSPTSQASDTSHGHRHSATPSLYGKHSGCTATIRPQECSGMATVTKSSVSHSAARTADEAARMTPLDIKIAHALKELKKKRQLEEKEASGNPFTRILLKFPLVAKAFNSVRSTFEEFDISKRGYIVYADVERAFEKLGVSFSKDEISQVCEETDMLENGKLTFKEFLVCLAIGFVLHKIPSLESERLSIFYAPLSTNDKATPLSPSHALLFGEGNTLRMAFQLAVDAFLWFDVDGSGLISADEMAMRLGTSTQLHSPTKKTSNRKEQRTGGHYHREPSDAASINSVIWERRFHEMDWNHDGTIQFKEFLLAFESWVGLDEDDDAVDST